MIQNGILATNSNLAGSSRQSDLYRCLLHTSMELGMTGTFAKLISQNCGTYFRGHLRLWNVSQGSLRALKRILEANQVTKCHKYTQDYGASLLILSKDL